MNWFAQIKQRRQMQDDLEEELRQHLEAKCAQLMSEGMPEAEAQRQARIALGNPELVRERSAEVWMWLCLATLIADVRYALRQARKNVGLSVAATLTLTLGIGANLAIFNILDALLLQGLPVHDPDSLVHLAARNGMANFGNPDAPANLNLPTIELIRQRAQSFDGVLGWSGRDFALDERGEVHSVPSALVTGNSFSVLGLSPAAGRLLDVQDDRPGGGPGGWAVVVSYGFWREHYGGSSAVLGQQVKLSGMGATIVGVAPRGFDSVILDNHPAFYLPMEFAVATDGEHSMVHSAAAMWLTTFARLKPNVTRMQAGTEMDALWPGMMETEVPAKIRHAPFIESLHPAVLPGRSGWSYLRVAYARPLAILQGMVGLLFVLCCANLAGLSLGRAVARRHEFAIRGALGAARGRMLQMVLIESFVLALPGALFALLFAWQADRFLVPMMDLEGMRLHIAFDSWFLLGAPVAACVAAVLVGILPASIAGRFVLQPQPAGSSQTKTSLASRAEGWLFLPLQIAASLVLLIGAGLLTATLTHLRTDNLGFETKGVYLAGVDFTKLNLPRASLIQGERNLVDRIAQMPGITNAGAAIVTPLNGSLASSSFSALESGRPVNNPIQLDTNQVGPGYFAAIGTPMLQGRDFTESPGDQTACVVNRSATGRLFGAQGAVGKNVRVSQVQVNGDVKQHDCLVIGEVADAKYDTLREDPPATVYEAIGQGLRADPAYPTIVMRARSLADAKDAYTKAMDELGHGAVREEVVPFAQQVNASVQRERMLALLSNFFAVLALLLSAIGVFGVMARMVAQRTAEIGVRMTLGATRAGILRQVLMRAARIACAGLVAGLAGAYFASASLRSLLYGLEPTNPAILLLSCLVLSATVALAAFFPARRAASIDPMQALRHE